MTYSTGTVVFGIEITHLARQGSPYKQLVCELNDASLISSTYNGLGENPYWLGVTMGYIDVCETTDVSEIKLVATDKDRGEFTVALELFCSTTLVPEELAEALKKVEPKVLIIWGSS